jgi:hypothetical protein
LTRTNLYPTPHSNTLTFVRQFDGNPGCEIIFNAFLRVSICGRGQQSWKQACWSRNGYYKDYKVLPYSLILDTNNLEKITTHTDLGCWSDAIWCTHIIPRTNFLNMCMSGLWIPIFCQFILATNHACTYYVRFFIVSRVSRI